jgi:predicted house-cleaning noncanonical NTP pyrophosphatase (MazG superfamily)
LEGPEKIHALADKIIEEAVEFCAEGKDHKKRARELAQMYGIIRAIASEMGMTIAEIEAIEDVKRDELGAYDEGYFVKTVTLPEENEWAEYYRSQPDRFPIVVE